MLAACLAVLLAQGGPPLLTDDCATPGDGRFEVNVAFRVEKFRSATLYEAPLVDFNYGLGERVQLKAELPWLIREESSGSDQSGVGNALLGLKYRFLDQEDSGLEASVYPQLELLLSAHSRRSALVEEGPALLLPVQIARDFGPIALNAELGYLLLNGEDDAWVWGLAAGREVLEGLQLLGEFRGESETGLDGGAIVWNLGARISLSESNLLLISAGRGLRGESRSEPQWIGYLGLQFLF